MERWNCAGKLLLPSHFPSLESENVFILHQKMRETSQKMRETMDESTENGKKRDILYDSLPTYTKI